MIILRNIFHHFVTINISTIKYFFVLCYFQTQNKTKPASLMAFIHITHSLFNMNKPLSRNSFSAISTKHNRSPRVIQMSKSSPLPPIQTQRGPSTPPPDYTNIDSNPLNSLFTRIFLSKLQAELKHPNSIQRNNNNSTNNNNNNYAAVIDVVHQLSHQYKGQPEELNAASQRVIASLFPNWLPIIFVTFFATPFPKFAAWLNAIVTVTVTQWLMGSSKISNDGTTVEIERCRYLEETGCVGICLHSCKAATEGYFEKNMGIPLAIEPNLDDFSCKFQFGKVPLPKHEDEMYLQPCLSRCPSVPSSSQSLSFSTPENQSKNNDQNNNKKSVPCHAIAGVKKKQSGKESIEDY